MKNLVEDIVKFSPSRKGRRNFWSADSVLGLDTPLSSKDSQLYLSEKHRKRHGAFFVFLVFIAAFVFLARAFVLQVIKGEENLALSEGNRIRAVNLQAERGIIYDRGGRVLAGNKPAFSVELNTEFCKKSLCEDVLEKIEKGQALLPELEDFQRLSAFGRPGPFLASRLKIDEKYIQSMIKAGKTNIVVADNMTKSDILPLEPYLASLPAVTVSVNPVRDYMYKDSFAHLIGYVGYADTFYPAIEGKSGIEQYYNDEISGVSGSKIVQTDSAGKSFAVLSEVSPIPGKKVELYVDSDLQNRAYELLKKKVDEDENATGGAIVARDPRNGGILALVSYPSFDPQKLSTGRLSPVEFEGLKTDAGYPFFNRVISAAYPPASTFKLIVAAGVLADGVVDEFRQIFDRGFIRAGGLTFRNWKADGHGAVNLRRAIQISNDTYFYIVGGGYGDVSGLGIDRLSVWAKKFGFGSKTGIDLPGEVSGSMPDGSSQWYLGDTYITSIGQGDVLATPMQVNNVTSFFANRGFLFKPSVVKSVGGNEAETEVLEQNVVDRRIVDIVREGMNMAVEAGGTAYPLFDFARRHGGLRLAGKTGTAEFGGKESGATHAWFTVFGPYDEDEKVEATIALTIFLEGGGSGADDAAPIARELLDFWFDVQ